MNPWSIPPIVAAGISFYVAHYHLVVYAKRRLHLDDLFFSLTCYSICGYDLLCAGRYRATTVIEAAAWIRGQLIAVSLFTTALLWFVGEYTGNRRRGARIGASLFSLAAIGVQAVDRTRLTLIVDPAAVKRILLPFGLDVTYHEPGAGPFTVVQVAVALAVLSYCLWTVVSSPRQPWSANGWPLPLALSMFCAAVFNDAAVFLGLYRFLYLTEYAYVVLIMLMSFALSRAAVSADVAGDRFRTLVENSPTGVFVVDDRYRFHYINDEASRILGRSREELLGMDFRHLLDGRWHDLVADRYRHRQRGDAVDPRYEVGIRRGDGTRRRIELVATTFRHTGRTVHTLGQILDVTERRATEEDLRQAHAVILNSPAVIVRRGARPGWPIELVSENVSRFGYRAAELLGGTVSWIDLIHPDDRPRVVDEAARRIAAAATDFRLEYRLLNREGRAFFVDDRTVVEYDERGMPVRLPGVVMDISERVTLERENEERRGFLERILATAPDAVVTADTRCRIQEWNPGAERLFGFTRAEMIGRAIEETLAAGDPRVAAESAGWLRLLRSGRMIPATETIRFGKDGTPVDVLATAAPIMAGAEWIGLVAIYTGIADQKRARDEIRRLNADLEARVQRRTAALQAVNRELEAFAYSVSHDLRAPLREIDGFARALEEDCGAAMDGTGRKYLLHIRGGAGRMGDLIEGLLALSRVAREAMHLDRVDLSALAREISDALARRDGGRVVACSIAEGLTTRGDHRLLRSALENLFENAWKFTAHRAPARIDFGREVVGGETAYFVRDNGAGFDMAYAARLFQAFQRLHRAEEYPGIGLGLATVQRIIHRHGGRVWAEGRVNGGATVWFTLGRGAEGP